MNPGIMLVLLLALDMFSGIYSLPRMVLLSFPGSWGCPMPDVLLGRAPKNALAREGHLPREMGA